MRLGDYSFEIGQITTRLIGEENRLLDSIKMDTGESSGSAISIRRSAN